MNKLLFDESWRSGVQSILNYTADQSAYYMGTDIAMSFLRELKGEYRIDILHPTGEAGKRSAEAFSAIFLNRLDGLIEDPNNRH